MTQSARSLHGRVVTLRADLYAKRRTRSDEAKGWRIFKAGQRFVVLGVYGNRCNLEQWLTRAMRAKARHVDGLLNVPIALVEKP